MRCVQKAKLLSSEKSSELSVLIQETINEFIADGLTVSIDKVFTDSARKGGTNSNSSKLVRFALVVGYDE